VLVIVNATAAGDVNLNLPFKLLSCLIKLIEILLVKVVLFFKQYKTTI